MTGKMKKKLKKMSKMERCVLVTEQDISSKKRRMKKMI